MGIQTADIVTRKAVISSIVQAAMPYINVKRFDVCGFFDSVEFLLSDVWSASTIGQSLGQLPASISVNHRFDEILPYVKLKTIAFDVCDSIFYLPLISDEYLLEFDHPIKNEIGRNWENINSFFSSVGALKKRSTLNKNRYSIRILESTYDPTDIGKIMPDTSRGCFHIAEGE
jgi:hypothetical protein